MKVRNMLSPNGNKVANQFIISDKNGETFQSYETIVAKIQKGGMILDTNALNYSRTTSKYLYEFAGMNRKEIEKGIKVGDVLVKNLNK